MHRAQPTLLNNEKAQKISEFKTPLLNQIEIHLVSNFYPRIPKSMAQACVDALDAYWEEDTDRMIDMPEGVSYKGSTSAPAWAIVEQHRLWPWLQEEEDYDE